MLSEGSVFAQVCLDHLLVQVAVRVVRLDDVLRSLVNNWLLVFVIRYGLLHRASYDPLPLSRHPLNTPSLLLPTSAAFPAKLGFLTILLLKLADTALPHYAISPHDHIVCIGQAHGGVLGDEVVVRDELGVEDCDGEV